jgi:hypothetical protein
MAIELSNLKFTEQDDIVPPSGIKEILINMGIANTLAGDDLLKGDTGKNLSTPADRLSGISNTGTLNTADGNDTIIGTGGSVSNTGNSFSGLYNSGTIHTDGGNDVIHGLRDQNGLGYGIYLEKGGTIDTGDGNDDIIGTTAENGPKGISIDSGSINTGNGDDLIRGRGTEGITVSSLGIIDTGMGNDQIRGVGFFSNAIYNTGTIISGDGNDIINGNGRYYSGLANYSDGIFIGTINTGDGDDTIGGLAKNGITNGSDSIIDAGNGNDIITGSGTDPGSGDIGIRNDGTINTGNGEDSIICSGKFVNAGEIFLGDDNDSLTAHMANRYWPGPRVFENFNFIGTGNGNDIITSAGFIYNEGVIDTGNGDDSIIVTQPVGSPPPFSRYGIYNNGGTIITGNGNDSIIANGGFESGLNSSGSVFLGEGEDYLKGFGLGDFYGGNGNDILELTPGTYNVGRWGETVTFSKGSSLMLATEFEQLIAGNTTYDFSNLTAGNTIVIA